MRHFVSSRLYLLCLVTVPIVAWVLPVLVVRFHLPPGVEPTMYASLIDYGYNTAGRNDDVVLFGDSSALYGVNPRQLGEDLGVKAINLPNTLGSLTVLGDHNLRHYLQHNRPPRVIVFYFAAWNLDYAAGARDGFMFEGEEAMLRHQSWSETWRFTRRHPREALVFPGRYYAGLARTLVSGGERRRRHDAEIEREQGHLDDAARFPALAPACTIPSWFLDQSGIDTTSALAQRYRNQDTAVLVYVAPVPTCTGAETVRSRSYAALQAAPPQTIPAIDFKDDESYAHLQPDSVPAATRALEQALRPLLVNR